MRETTQAFFNIDTFHALKEVYPHPNVIKAMLVLNGISISDMARENGLRPGAFYDLLKGHRADPRAMATISKALCVPGRELFPPRNGSGRKG